MQQITVTKSYAGSQLMAELIAAVPTFLRTTAVTEFGRTINHAITGECGGVESYPDGRVRVTFADDISSSAVQTVIDAHTPA